jgi:hypothetical protein
MTCIFLQQMDNNKITTLITISPVSSSSSSPRAWLSFEELLTPLAQFRVVNEKILKTSTGVMVSMVLAGRQTSLESVLNHNYEYTFPLTLFRQNYTFQPSTLYQGPLLPFEQPFPNQELHLFSVRFLVYYHPRW